VIALRFKKIVKNLSGSKEARKVFFWISQLFKIGKWLCESSCNHTFEWKIFLVMIGITVNVEKLSWTTKTQRVEARRPQLRMRMSKICPWFCENSPHKMFEWKRLYCGLLLRYFVGQNNERYDLLSKTTEVQISGYLQKVKMSIHFL